jgi:hypothetical protein
MRTHALLFALVISALPANANLYVPRAKLAGETVRVRLQKDSAEVTAVFEFAEWFTRDAKVLYFPIFSADVVDPIQLLARSGFELEIEGQKIGMAAPCAPPARFKLIPGSPRIYWFSADLEELGEKWNEEVFPRVVVRVSYSQPMVRGSFYYLPIIVGTSEKEERRAWHYQMQLHAASRVPRVLSKGTDYEQLADTVVVYLKDGEIVEVR